MNALIANARFHFHERLFERILDIIRGWRLMQIPVAEVQKP